MALDPRTTRGPHGSGPETKADVTAFVEHVQENPVLYVAAVAFLVVCVVIGVAFRAYRSESEQAGATAYARALDTELPAARADALVDVSAGPDWMQAESLYMAGEAAFDAGDLEKAQTLFEQLRAEHPDYEFTPDAVEALGVIAEEEDDYTAALTRYEEIGEVWPDSFAARRQPMNIGRAQEAAGNYEAAIVAYRDQLDIFPGSNAALRAQQALDRLRQSQPTLFPEETVATDPVDTGVTSPLDIDLNVDSTPLEGEMSESAPPEQTAAPEEGTEQAPPPDVPEAAAEAPEVHTTETVETPEADAQTTTVEELTESGEEAPVVEPAPDQPQG